MISGWRGPLRSVLTMSVLFLIEAVRWDSLRQALAILRDVARSRADLLAENALLRQQLLALRRQVAKPHLRGRPMVDGRGLLDHPNVARSTASGAARDVAPLAPGALPARMGSPMYVGSTPWPNPSTRDHRAYPQDRRGEPAVGGRSDSERTPQGWSTGCKRTIQKYMRQARNPLSSQDLGRQRSCVSKPKGFWPATSSNSTTRGSVPCSRSSPSNTPPGASSTSA